MLPRRNNPASRLISFESAGRQSNSWVFKLGFQAGFSSWVFKGQPFRGCPFCFFEWMHCGKACVIRDACKVAQWW
jgi:hypothetical protein